MMVCCYEVVIGVLTFLKRAIGLLVDGVGAVHDSLNRLYWRIDAALDWVWERAIRHAERREARRGR